MGDNPVEYLARVSTRVLMCLRHDELFEGKAVRMVIPQRKEDAGNDGRKQQEQ